MRTTRTVVVEKEITTYKCDFCEYQTENNNGCCGQRSIMICGICGKDACSVHRKSFYEYDQDYPDITVCADCLPIFEHVWNYAIREAGRGDDISEFCKQTMKEIEQIGFEQWKRKYYDQ